MEEQEGEIQVHNNESQEPEKNSQKNEQTTNNITYQNTTILKARSPQRRQFVLDCDNRKQSRLPAYNGLTDKFLSPFFQNPKIRQNLLKVGLVFKKIIFENYLKINPSNEIIETKKPVIVPFIKLDPIVQRKHICHKVAKRKASSNQPFQHMSQSSTMGSKCFSTSKNKKMYYYEKLPPLKTPTQGSKIHLPEIYLEKNFHQFANEYLEFLQNNSVDQNKSLERQFIEKYKTQQQKKLIRHYVPLHTQVCGVKEDSLAWKFHTEINQQQQQKQESQFGRNKNNFFKQNDQKNQNDYNIQKDNSQKNDDYDDDEYSEENNSNEDKKYDEEFSNNKDSKSNYDEEFDKEEINSNKDKIDDEEEDYEKDSLNNNQKQSNNKDDDYEDDINNFEDEEEQQKSNKEQSNQIEDDDYANNDFDDEDIN